MRNETECRNIVNIPRQARAQASGTMANTGSKTPYGGEHDPTRDPTGTAVSRPLVPFTYFPAFQPSKVESKTAAVA